MLSSFAHSLHLSSVENILSEEDFFATESASGREVAVMECTARFFTK